MKIVAALLGLTLVSCASNRSYDPLEWSSLGTGCYARGLSDVLLSPDDFGTVIGLTDIRIGRLPDTGRGPGLLAHFRRNKAGESGQSTNQPELFLAIGDWKRSCAILIRQDACTAAADVYTHLAAQSIPVGHAFDDADGITVLHGTMYFLSSRDGHGNQIDWSYYGVEHPLLPTVSAALDELESCAAPAIAKFNRAGLE